MLEHNALVTSITHKCTIIIIAVVVYNRVQNNNQSFTQHHRIYRPRCAVLLTHKFTK
eukprot:SAG31_NODE_1161_length_9593_cov_3.825629_5_plen_57_part_00